MESFATKGGEMEKTGRTGAHLSEAEFVQLFLTENPSSTKVEEIIDENVEEQNLSLVSSNAVSNCDEPENINGSKELKRKRRSRLGEFSKDQSIKRKNEQAKRELTSIVNQLGKIDKQLNADKDESRVSINFNATFTAYKSNRVNTFKYPPGAEIKQTVLDFDNTITAVKSAVKEAVNDLVKQLPKNNSSIDIPTSSTAATVVFATPTKTTAEIEVFPSPVTAKGPPLLSRSLCAKSSCTFGKRLKKPVWIKCKHRYQEGYECNYLVHSACLGFPTLKDNEVKQLKCWYCPDHTEMEVKRK